MPSKFVIRSFSENSYYHIFNRGVEKRNIFEDKQDYQIFKYYLFIYLLPLETVLAKYPQLPLRLQARNLNGQVDLIAYCLMPNHFHLLLKQANKDSISRFMKQLTNAHTEYFNKKYHRDGGLVQGRFKAALINSEPLLLHISRYIHLNPLVAKLINNLQDYPWSSYLDYFSDSKYSLCKTEIILQQFSSKDTYKQFILDQIEYAKELNKIKHLTVDE